MIPLLRPRWTPKNLARPPRVWLDSRDASWSGSSLAGIGNRGIDRTQGSPTINGTWSRGAPLGNVPTLRNGADSSYIEALVGAFSSGQFSLFWFGASQSSSGVGGIAGSNWPGGSPQIAFYLMTGGSGVLWFGNQCCTVGTNNPSFGTSAEIVVDTLPHSLFGQMGATQALYLDGVSQALSPDGFAAVPNYGGGTNFQFGNTGPASGEGLNADTVAWLLFDYWPSDRERQKLEGYFHGITRQSAKLPASHPYKNRLP